jgi:hypothetical protein
VALIPFDVILTYSKLPRRDLRESQRLALDGAHVHDHRKMAGRSIIRGKRGLWAAAATRPAPVIDDPMKRWAKLAWDMHMFREYNSQYPDDRAQLAHRIVSICVTAWSLRVWTEQKLAHRRKRHFHVTAFREQLAKAVPQQPLCDAVAEIARTAYHRQGRWPSNLLEMRFSYPGEPDPVGWMLTHSAADRDYSLTIFTFLCIDRDWRTFLEAQGLADGGRRPGRWARLFARKR